MWAVLAKHVFMHPGPNCALTNMNYIFMCNIMAMEDCIISVCVLFDVLFYASYRAVLPLCWLACGNLIIELNINFYNYTIQKLIMYC